MARVSFAKGSSHGCAPRAQGRIAEDKTIQVTCSRQSFICGEYTRTSWRKITTSYKSTYLVKYFGRSCYLYVTSVNRSSIGPARTREAQRCQKAFHFLATMRFVKEHDKTHHENYRG